MASSLRQEPAASPAWFASLAILGALYVAPFLFRLVAHLALYLRRPKDLRRRYGAWAVVTGPTSGIGRAVALELARRGLNLVLLDLNAANLLEISETIRSRHGVKTRTVLFDLSTVATPRGKTCTRAVKHPKHGTDSQAEHPHGRVRRRGDGAAPGGHRGAGRRCAGEQRRRGEAGLAVPARGGRGGVGEDDKGEPVGGDRGDGGGAAGDGGAGQGRRREHGVGVVGGHPLFPSLHHVRRHQTVCCSVLQEPLRRVQKQGDRRAMPGPVLRGDRDGVEALGDQSPRPAPRRAGARRVRARGYALDRPRPAALRAQPQPPAPVVPRRRSAGPRPRLAPPAPQPAPPRPVLQTLVGKSSAKDQVTPQPQMEFAPK